MDQPPRATAAQMASRNIKQAKRKARVVGHLETPRDSVPQFSTLPTQTGLFGGQLQLPSAQSSTEFNFSVAQNPVLFPSSINSAPFNLSNLANAQPVPSPKKAPSALGQSFTINWPTSTTASTLDTTSQSVASPQKAPSALGQNFTINWPAASEQPAVNQGAKPLVETIGENGIQAAGGLSMPSVSGQSQQTPSTNQKIYGESKWALGEHIPLGALDPIPDEEKSRPRTAEELELDEMFPSHLYGPGGPLAPAFPYGDQLGKTSEKPSQQMPAKSYVFGQPNVSSGSVGQSELAPPTSNVLGQSQTTTSTNNIFGKVQPTSTSNIFGQVQLAPTNNILGNPQPIPPTSNLFGQSQPATSTSNLFGQVKPAPTSNVLGTSQPAPASNILGQVHPATTNNDYAQSQPAPPTSNIFGQSTLPTNGIFGSQQTTSTTNNFGNSLNFNQTSFNAASTTVAANTTTSINGTHTSAGNNMFNPSQKTDGFGVPQSPTPFNPSNSTAPIAQTPAMSSNNIFGNQQSSNLFNSTNSTPPVTQTSTLPSSNIFGSQQSSNLFKSSNEVSKNPVIQQPTNLSNNLFGSLQSPNLLNSSNEAPLNFHTSAISEPTNLLTNQGVSHTFPDLNKFSTLTDEAISTHMPAGLDEAEQYQFRAAFRLRALNIATATVLNKLSVVYAPEALFDYVQEQRRKVLAECKVNLIRLGRFTEPASTSPALNIPATTSTPAALVAPIPSVPKTSNPPTGFIFSSTPQSKRKHAVEDDEDQENRNPSKRTRNIEEPTPKPPSNHTPRINNEQATPVPSTRKGKRRAEDELNQDTEQLNPLRQKLNGPNQNGIISGQSNTSNILRGIIETPKETPRKIKGPSTFSAKSSQPTSNPFGILPVPSSQGNSASSTNAPQLSTLKDTPSNLFSPKPTPPTAPTNPFSPKPASSTSINGTASQPIKPPVFGTGSINFLAQFGQKASADEKDNEAKLMEKAKAEDMDSDEDEKEWEAKWKATRREELKKLKESSKSKKAKFVEGRGFIYDHSEASDSSDSSTSTNFKAIGRETSSLFNSPNPSRQSTPGLRSNTGSVLDGNSGPINTEHNIFGNLSSKGSGSEDADADNDSSDGENGHGEDSENINPSHQSGQTAEMSSMSARKTSPFGSTSGSGVSSSSLIDRALKDTDGKPIRSNPAGDKESSETSTPKRSLFDRIDKDDNGKPIRSFSTEEKENTQPTAIVFGGANNPFASSLNKPAVPESTQPNGSSIFGEVKNPFKSSSSNSNPVDQTWKPNSPIKFGQSTTAESAPTVSVTAATPPKSQSPSIFGSHKPQAQFTGFGNFTASNAPATSNLFGNSNSMPTSTAPSTIFGSTAPSNLFGSSTPSSSLFGATKLPTSTSVGFAFGGNSTTSSLFPSATGSADTSRATSPAGTTDNDSGVENDPDAEKHEQIDLTAGGPGEENENVVFEVRSKLMKFDPKEKQWPVQGLGPLRVLKHKETGVARIVMRADPSGKLLLNKAILPQIYEANGKTMKLTSASDSGKGLETYLVQVKEPEMAKKLAEELNANKS